MTIVKMHSPSIKILGFIVFSLLYMPHSKATPDITHVDVVQPDLVSSLTTTPTGTHAIDPIFAKLKPYRTYYQIDAMSPYAHQFTVHLAGSDDRYVIVRGNTESDINTLKSVPAIIKGTPVSFTPAPAPESIGTLETAVKGKISQLYPEARDVTLAYDGEIRGINVRETIVLSSSTQDIWQRVASMTILAFTQKKGRPGLALDKTTAPASGVHLLCDPANAQSCVQKPNFLPFLSSPDTEARSLFLYSFSRKSENPEARLKFPELDHELDRLWPFIVSTANEMDAKKYSNPIDTILEKQWGGLAKNLQVFFNPRLHCTSSPINKPQGKQTVHVVHFGFTLTQLLKGFELQSTIPETGLTATMRANDKELHIHVRKSSADAIEFSWAMNMEANLIAANGSLAPRNGAIKLQEVKTDNDDGDWKKFPETSEESIRYRCRMLDNESLQIFPSGALLGASSP